MGLLIRYDIKNGILLRWKLYLPLLLVPFLFGAALAFPESPPGFIEGLLHYFRGMGIFDPGTNQEFTIPFSWLLFQLYVLFLTSSYPIRDLNQSGIQLFIRTGQRNKFWGSKCIWNLCTVLISWLLYLVGIALVVLLGKGSLLEGVDAERVLQLSGLMVEGISTGKLLFCSLVLPLVSLIAMGTLQQALSLFWKDLPSYVATVVLLCASAFWCTPFLIGNHSMLLRTLYGDWLLTALIVDVLVIAVSLMVGFKKFSKFDILG